MFSRHVPLLGPVEFMAFVTFGVVVRWLGDDSEHGLDERPLERG